jgi:L-fuconolactonase
MRIDAHQHFWELRRGDYGWLTSVLDPIYRDFGPDDLAPHLRRTGIDRTVLVQAAPTEAETAYLLGLAERTSFVAAVVGWVDLSAPDAPRRIERVARNKRLRGLRPMLQDIPDAEWILQPALRPAMEAMIACGLRFDALVRPQHLRPLLQLMERHRDLKVIIDHAAKPCFGTSEFERWKQDLAVVARSTQAFCKISGLLTEAPACWEARELQPCVDHLVDCFGPERLAWGSDWPVVELVASYEGWHAIATTCLRGLRPEDQRRIFGETAAGFYGLG